MNPIPAKRGEAATSAEPAGPNAAVTAPMLASTAAALPAGEDWLFEVKWDGYRVLATVRGGTARLSSRNGHDLTARFPRVAEDLVAATPGHSFVVDGEICALDGQGRPSFSALQQGAAAQQVTYAHFDLLELDDELLTGLPLTERRRRLEALLGTRAGSLRFSEAFDDGAALFAAVTAQGLEGVMAKRASSRYVPGRRTRDWVKVKARSRQELLICGWTRGRGRRASRFGSLVLGVHREGVLAYAGNCGTGFDDETVDALAARMTPLERPTPPFGETPVLPRVHRGDVTWVEPSLVCEIEFSEWTHAGRLRAPSFVRLFEPEPTASPQGSEAPARDGRRRRRRRQLTLTNLDKVFWPETGITKGDLVDYYEAIAPVLVPHLRKRPFTMRRYPDGIGGKTFFQKDAPDHMPSWLATQPVTVGSGRGSLREERVIEAPLVNDERALLWMVNAGCIDMNPWYSRIDRLDRPDFVLFDLDPSDGVGIAETVEVALLVKQALDALGLRSYPKTSGADGIHVVAPIERRYTYEQTRGLAGLVAAAIARSHPGLATTEWVKSRRRGVLIDANQNGLGKTIASAYSVRPRPGAPVSTPLHWHELDERLDPLAFTMGAVLERVRSQGDLHEGALTDRQRLERALGGGR